MVSMAVEIFGTSPTGRRRRRRARPRHGATAVKDERWPPSPSRSSATPSAPRSRRRRRPARSPTTRSRRTILDALEANGVLVFRGLHLDPESQVAFCRHARRGRHDSPATTRSRASTASRSTPSKNPPADVPARHVRLAHRRLHARRRRVPADRPRCSPPRRSPRQGGETEFASTYAAYDDLDDDEQERLDSLRVVHSLEASQRLVTPDPTPEQLAAWRRQPTAGAPAGLDAQLRPPFARDRRVGLTTSSAWSPEEGRQLLDDLLDRVDRARAGVPARVVSRRHGDLGQPRRAAPCRAVRPGARRGDAAHDRPGRRADPVARSGPTAWDDSSAATSGDESSGASELLARSERGRRRYPAPYSERRM